MAQVHAQPHHVLYLFRMNHERADEVASNVHEYRLQAEQPPKLDRGQVEQHDEDTHDKDEHTDEHALACVWGNVLEGVLVLNRA